MPAKKSFFKLTHYPSKGCWGVVSESARVATMDSSSCFDSLPILHDEYSHHLRRRIVVDQPVDEEGRVVR